MLWNGLYSSSSCFPLLPQSCGLGAFSPLLGQGVGQGSPLWDGPGALLLPMLGAHVGQAFSLSKGFALGVRRALPKGWCFAPQGLSEEQEEGRSVAICDHVPVSVFRRREGPTPP